jgi:hypothetical protein
MVRTKAGSFQRFCSRVSRSTSACEEEMLARRLSMWWRCSRNARMLDA